MEHHIKKLIEKLYQGNCTEEEIDLLLEHFNSSNLDTLEKEIKKEWDKEDRQLPERLKTGIWRKIQNRIDKGNQKTVRPKLIPIWKGYYRYAAILIVIIGISFFYIDNSTDQEIEPNAVTLEFGNGERLNIENGNEKSSSERGLVYENDILKYDPLYPADSLEYHTIRIPNGRKFQLELSDGTRIHLNAGPTLRYPFKFIEGTDRTVFLTGEAFFQVAKGEDKFTVTTKDLKTEVLGTEFNVSAYGGQTHTEIVLLEGSIRVNGNQSKTLLPNEKLVHNGITENWNIETVNAADYIVWIDGILWFRNESFKEIIPKLERHYNVELNNHYNEIEDKRFTGRFEREELEEVLNIFKIARDFNYKISRDNVTIERPKSTSKKL